MSKPSPEPTPDREPPEFIVDRTLGKTLIRHLRQAEWHVHAVAEIFENDGQFASDEEWVAYACEQGLVGLTSDKRIRRQPAYHLACRPIIALSSNQLLIEEQVRRLLQFQDRIHEVACGGRGFWILYGDRLNRLDPP